MKRFHAICLFLFICCATAMAQAKPSVSILGDSYSTFEGYLTPDTMDIWYFENKQDPRRTDVKSVSETWWMQLIKRKNWKLELNNSWSNAPVGEYKYEDWRRADLYTFRPAMACMLHKIKERYPTADVYFISNDGLKPEITESMAQICKRYDVPMIQLENISKTAGHPNVKGMTQIAEQLDKAIK